MEAATRPAQPRIFGGEARVDRAERQVRGVGAEAAQAERELDKRLRTAGVDVMVSVDHEASHRSGNGREWRRHRLPSQSFARANRLLEPIVCSERLAVARSTDTQNLLEVLL